MKRLFMLVALATALFVVSCKRYQTVTGDPLDAKIYTLSNGLQLYMSVNKDEPKVRGYVAVRVGAKDDPADNTGMANHLQHLLGKGTRLFGTTDYRKEGPLLARMDSLFDAYSATRDPAQRAALFARLDAVNQQASKLAIPNEYVRLMNLIGADNSDAYVTEDVTCFMEEFPSNQAENWLRIQADRFMNNVFRDVLSEQAAVVREKNEALTSDSDKAMTALNALLFPGHPYGTQTIIGAPEHLENPCGQALRRMKRIYYVPNNMAICLSGDLDPDRMVELVEKYFGAWQSNEELPERGMPAFEPVMNQTRDVWGPEPEFVLMGWRTPGCGERTDERASIVTSILNNGLAGLLDIHVIQQQRVLEAHMANMDKVDAGMFLARGVPKNGQTLEEVQAILQAEIDQLKAGDFPDELLMAAKANFKLSRMKVLLTNTTRAGLFMNAFCEGISWSEHLARIRRTFDITKEDVVAWANTYLTPENMAVVRKRSGVDPSVRLVNIPKMTPVVSNRDKQSKFYGQIAAVKTDPVEPSFVDFQKDMTVSDLNGLRLLYKRNDKNHLAYFSLWYDSGADADPLLPLATDYLHFLGTRDMSAADFARKFYSMGYEWHINESPGTMTISLSGLDENLGQAHDLLETLLHEPQANEEMLAQLKSNILRDRAAAKKRRGSCNNALARYVMYGPEYIKATTLTNPQLMAVTSERLLASLREAISHQHTILYYGPSTLEEVKQMLASHRTEGLKPVKKSFATKIVTTTPQVFVCQFDSREASFMQYSNRGESLIVEQAPYIELFNEYFNAGLHSVVSQKLRESPRAMVHGATVNLVRPSFSNDAYYLRAAVNTRYDKLRESVKGLSEILETVPESPEYLDMAKQSILNRISTSRVNGVAVLYYYLRMQDLGLDFPREKLIYDKVSTLGIYDLLYTHESWIRNRTYHYAVLGNVRELDMGYLRKLGHVQVLTQEEIFGY